MRFFRENSRLISRLFVNQVGMTIFGLILTMAVMRASENNGLLIMAVSIFSIIFYLCLIYNVMWEEGARNIIRINAGHRDYIRAFPVKVALLASVPNLVLAALLFVSYLLGYSAGAALFRTIYGVLHIILGAFEAMFVGLFSVILERFSDLSVRYLMACVLYFLSSLPMILTSLLAYTLGKRNIYVFGKRNPKQGGGN